MTEIADEHLKDTVAEIKCSDKALFRKQMYMMYWSRFSSLT